MWTPVQTKGCVFRIYICDPHNVPSLIVDYMDILPFCYTTNVLPMKEGRHLSNFSKARQATSEDAWALFISRCPCPEPPTNMDSSVFIRILKLITDEKMKNTEIRTTEKYWV